MKTAISIKDNIFQKAEKIAKKPKFHGVSFMSDALEEHLAKRDEQTLIDQINTVYEKVDTSLDPFWKKAQAQILKKEEW